MTATKMTEAKMETMTPPPSLANVRGVIVSLCSRYSTPLHITNALTLLLASFVGGDVSLWPCDDTTTCCSCHLRAWVFLFSLGREQERTRDGDERENKENKCKVLCGPQVHFFLHFFVYPLTGCSHYLG